MSKPEETWTNVILIVLMLAITVLFVAKHFPGEVYHEECGVQGMSTSCGSVATSR